MRDLSDFKSSGGPQVGNPVILRSKSFILESIPIHTIEQLQTKLLFIRLLEKKRYTVALERASERVRVCVCVRVRVRVRVC